VDSDISHPFSSVGAVYFFDIRPAMYVLRTTITAMTIAIKTAAVGQSMTFLRYAIRLRVMRHACNRR